MDLLPDADDAVTTPLLRQAEPSVAGPRGLNGDQRFFMTDAAAYFTASLTAFTGRARTALLAGLAANVCSCLVNGLMPLRAGRAVFFTTTNFAKPCSTNVPVFFSSLWPTSTSVSMTVFTCLRETPSPTFSPMAFRTSLFERGFVFLAVAGFAMG